MDQERLRSVIASAKAGDAEGYTALLEAYAPRLYGYFLRATGRHHDAEDLLSEATLRLVRQMDRYDERGRFDQWLFRIAANLVRDRIRRIKAAPPAVSLAAKDGLDRPLTERVAAKGPGVDARILAAEAGERLQLALDRLDATTREMILLRYFGQLSFKELAELLDRPLGTVLARVHRGLQALREIMGSEHELE